MTTIHDVAFVLSSHRGRDNGVTAAQLAGQLDIPERRLRHLISDMRGFGIAVCGHPATGYYIAATTEELESTCAFLRSRAMHSLVLESRLRKISLPDLIGQLRLNT